MIHTPANSRLFVRMRFYCLWLLLIGVWAVLLPITRDEAYYLMWAKKPALGYFDHPPFIAWLLANFSQIWGAKIFHFRLGNIFCAALVALVIGRIIRRCQCNINQSQNGLYLTLGNFGLMGIALLSTPDTPMLLFWSLALYEGLIATTAQPKRWLLAGLYCGFGLLAKYTMVLMAPVYFLAILKARQLKTVWPYLGGLIALLIFSPNIYWNSQNSWASMGFQMRHGMGHVAPKSVTNSLPTPTTSANNSFDSFRTPTLDDRETKKTPTLDEVTNKVGVSYFSGTLWRIFAAILGSFGFLTGQLLYFGFLLFPLAFALWQPNQRPSFTLKTPPIIMFSTIVPLCFFGTISIFSKVEANWPAMYLVGALVLAATRLQLTGSSLRLAAWANFTLTTVGVLHANFSILPLMPKDRILEETHGFFALAQHYKSKKKPLLVESYQLTSMVNYYAETMIAEQYPGIARDSELTHRFASWDQKSLRQKGDFYLLTQQPNILHIEGFIVKEHHRIQDCIQGSLLFQSHLEPAAFSCHPIHTWYETYYQAIRSDKQSGD